MDYKFSHLPKSEIEIEVKFSFSEFEPHVKKAANLLSEENEIEGFRRGKVPYDMVKQKFGEAAIYEKAADLAVRKTYAEVLTEIKNYAGGAVHWGEPRPEGREIRPIVPIGRPEITVIKLAPGNEFEYKIKVAILPEVKLGDYKAAARRVLTGEKKKNFVSEEEVDKAVEWLRESRTKLVTVDRSAEKGDKIEVDFEIRHGGVKIAGGESKNHPLILGSGKFMPGFEDEILGMKQGEEKSFILKVPEDWGKKTIAGRPSGQASPLAGKALEFKTKMNLVQKREMPDADDNFAKNLGGFANAEELKKNIREGIEEEKKEKEKERLRGRIMEEIAKEAKIEAPNVLVEAELDKMIEELKSGIAGMGMKWEDYLLHIKKNAEELRKEWRNQAQIRVRAALCLGEIARVEKIEPSEEEIQERANRFLEQFKKAEDAEKTIDAKELREYTGGILRNEKVFEFLENINK